ncbi:MAG: DUF3426 domain-containing protein [Gallionella sp.]|jgi:predicted Zn finger-like uncharacterized protein|nr:DUF3426 domain-containing protein [Gallionella sp.]
MDGTTLCPHCETRFKIVAAQLEAHQGMVRCGHCLQVFDARPNFIPDAPHPQLELEMSPAAIDEPIITQDNDESADAPVEARHPDNLDFMVPSSATISTEPLMQATPEAEDLTLAEQVEVREDEAVIVAPPKKRTWLWGLSSSLLVLFLFGQAAYFFRAEIAARMPDMKPILVKYCGLLGCTVTLPQKNDLMSIESSSLEADSGNAAQITLNALLRNRATYPLAYPDLELTLNDRQDKPVARRTFKPADYLPPLENEQTGLQPNHELSLKLLLDTTDLNPNGYRLVVLYPSTR